MVGVVELEHTYIGVAATNKNFKKATYTDVTAVPTTDEFVFR